MKSSARLFDRFAKVRGAIDLKRGKRRRCTMDRFLHFVSLFIVLLFAIDDTVEEGSCECAVFSLEKSESIIERALQYNVTCNSEGEKRCRLLCVAVAQSVKDEAPRMICEKLNDHVENLHVAVYSKACNATSWIFTGLKNPYPLCCHEGKSTPCKESPSIIDNCTNSSSPVNP